ncbi:hypothetical protein F2Q68_00003469 [Brassica cretica]|uniref:Uncharacterized protein n=1 Tax=Brassica cretica TaxID=69181 RepID=A0A8S9J700_BRACR|nr:hypothetical protein F2Q68_00003469 [Brassica cretica]
MQAILDVSVCHRRSLCWLKETRRRFWKSGETEERLKRGMSSFRTEEVTRSSFPLFRSGAISSGCRRVTTVGTLLRLRSTSLSGGEKVLRRRSSQPKVVALQQVHGEALLPSAGGGLVTSSVVRISRHLKLGTGLGMDVMVQAYHSYLLVVKRWFYLSRRKRSSHRGEMGNEQQRGSVGSNQVILSDTRSQFIKCIIIFSCWCSVFGIPKSYLGTFVMMCVLMVMNSK